jgi:hypothetical protein
MKFDTRELCVKHRSMEKPTLHTFVSMHVFVYPLYRFTDLIKIRFVRALLKVVGQFQVLILGSD